MYNIEGSKLEMSIINLQWKKNILVISSANRGIGEMHCCDDFNSSVKRIFKN